MTWPPWPPYPLADAGRPPYYRQVYWRNAYSKRNGVHYVGDEVIIDLNRPFTGTAYDTFKRYTTFEHGTNGQTVKNATQMRGDPYAPTTVTGSPTYSSTHSHSGSLSAQVGPQSTFMEWSHPAPTAQRYFRFYLYATAFPTSDAVCFRGNYWLGYVRSDGKPMLYDQGLVHNTVLGTPIALNQWVRLEWLLDYDADLAELRLFNDPASETPTSTGVVSPFSSQSDDYVTMLGCYHGNAWGSAFWLDDVVLFDSDWPGPDDPLARPTERPVAYTVRDYFGRVVTNGEFDEWMPWVELESPAGGWKPGWYRVYLTGSQTDTANGYGPSYGSGSFCVIKDDAHFTAMPPGDTVGGYGAEGSDFVMKGVMGVGTSRLRISNANAPTTGEDTIATCQANAAISNTYWTDNGLPDTERPTREMWLIFPGQTYDGMGVSGTTGDLWARIYPLDDSPDGSQIFLKVSAGTAGNTDKLQVYSPDSTTLVETYDNLASQTAAESAVNASSSYIKFFAGSNQRAQTFGPTAIGNSYREGVKQVVQTMYPLGVRYYEGPSNEPAISLETLHQMKLFQENVHYGNASAKAIGTCPVYLSNTFSRADWATLLDNGLASVCDEFSFHNYNAFINGNMNMGRYNVAALVALNAAHGAGSKPMWQTESNGSYCNQHGVYHPRLSRVSMIQTLVYEQYGIPRERDNYWYDTQHGFAGVPSWLANADGSLNPYALLHRVLAEETWGKPYDSALDFGPLGNAMYLGSIYSGSSGKCVVLQAASYMTGGSIVLTITGDAGPFTVVDGLGNERTMAPSKGRLTLPMTDIPTYVRLPAAASVSVYRINGWSPLGNQSSVSPSATTKTMGGVSYPVIADDAWMTEITQSVGIAPDSWGWMPVPSTIELAWSESHAMDRVIVWCTAPFQTGGTFVDFNVETYEGGDWTTQRTITKSLPYLEFGSDSSNTGCFAETYWDEQWIFDIELPNGTAGSKLRINVTAASYGGEPFSVVQNGADKRGEGHEAQGYRIEEIAVVDNNKYAAVA